MTFRWSEWLARYGFRDLEPRRGQPSLTSEAAVKLAMKPESHWRLPKRLILNVRYQAQPPTGQRPTGVRLAPAEVNW